MVKAAIYIRVSTDKTFKDGRFQDPANQLNPLTKWAEALGHEVVQVYEDRASGGDSNRPAFKKMRAEAHQCRFKILLVWSLDRFSREGIVSTMSYLRDLKRWGVGVKSFQEQWMDTSDQSPIAEVIIAILSWAAQQERQRISDRTKAGIAQRRGIGVWRGGRPKGARDKKPRKKRGATPTLLGAQTP